MAPDFDQEQACHHKVGLPPKCRPTRRGSMRSHCTLVLAAVTLLSAAFDPALALQASPIAQAQATNDEALTNEDVVKLVQAGIGDSVIIAKIKNSRTKFDTSPDTLIRLKQRGVSDAVLEALAQATGTIPSRPTPPADPNDPLSPHEPGIYLMKTERQGKRMVQLEPAAYSQVKLTGAPRVPLPVGTIGKSKWKAVLRGERARLRVSEPRPVFYFYFERAPAAAGAGGGSQTPREPVPTRGISFSAASGPNQFTLAKFETKNGERELVIGEIGGFGTSISMGISNKDVIEFDFQKLAPGVYKVAPRADLEPGEYCFIYTSPAMGVGASIGGQLFDFGVNPAQ